MVDFNEIVNKIYDNISSFKSLYPSADDQRLDWFISYEIYVKTIIDCNQTVVIYILKV
jgi:hypothetical protein